jgi:hypothetical protein
VAGGSWPERARSAATALAETQRETGAEQRELLLADVREIFDGMGPGTERISSRELVALLCEREDRPWCEWPQNTIRRAHRLSKGLRPFGIGPKQQWIAGTNVQGYSREQFTDAWRTYL